MPRSRNAIAFGIVAILIIVAFVLNLSLGTIAIPFRDVVDILLGRDTGGSEIWRNIVWKSRYPQTITEILSPAPRSSASAQVPASAWRPSCSSRGASARGR